MRIKLVLIVFIAGLSLQAQERMTLQECIDYSLANNEQLAIVVMENDVANTQIKDQLSGGLPQINGDIGITKNIAVQRSFIQDFISPAVYEVLKDENLLAQNTPVPESQTFPVSFGTNYSGGVGIGVSQLVFDGAFFVGLKAARIVRELNKKKQRQTEAEIIQNVSNAFHLVLISQENLNFLATNFSTIDTLLNETSAMFEHGLVEKIDVLRVKIQHNNIKINLRNSTEFLMTAMSLLKFHMGMPLQTQMTLNGSLNDLIIEDQPISDETSFLNRPEYGILQTNEALIKLNIKKFQSQYLPSIHASYNLGWTAGTHTFDEIIKINDKTWFAYSNIGVRMSIPIFDGWYKRSKIQQTKIQLSQTELRIDQLRNSINREIEEARIKLENARRAMITQEENVKLAREIYHVTKVKYQEGVGTNLEVIEANTELKEVQKNYLNAVYETITAQIQLKKSLGILNK